MDAFICRKSVRFSRKRDRSYSIPTDMGSTVSLHRLINIVIPFTYKSMINISILFKSVQCQRYQSIQSISQLLLLHLK